MAKLTVIEQNYLFQSDSDHADYVALNINDDTVNNFFSDDLQTWFESSLSMAQVRENLANFVDQFSIS